MPNTPPKSSGAKKWIRPVLSAVLAVFILFMVKYILTRSFQAKEYNQIVNELVDQQKYAEAVPRLEKLMETAQPAIRDEAKATLARCYAQLGDDPTQPLQKSAALLKKAYDLDPKSLNEIQLQAMNAGLAPPATGDSAK